MWRGEKTFEQKGFQLEGEVDKEGNEGEEQDNTQTQEHQMKETHAQGYS